MRTPSLLLVWMLVGCGSDRPVSPPDPDESPLLGVPETERWELPGLIGPAHVVRTEGNIPYIYASNRHDLGRVQGFVVARDRFFSMDLVRRLSQGRASELLGDAALATDLESRGLGMNHVVDQIMDALGRDPEMAGLADGFADGVNAYIDAVQAGQLPPPSELALLAPFLGGAEPWELMARWDRRDVAAVGATLVYQLGFETGDVGRAANHARLPDTYDPSDPLYALRQAGVVQDVWERVEPVYPVSSAPGWLGGQRRAAPAGDARMPGREVAVPPAVLDRLQRRLDRVERRLGHDREHGFGSNAWAVAGWASADGRSLLAGDGHLPLSVPSLFYAAGLDTAHLGDPEGGLSQVGLLLPGHPTLAVGTNGHVAWSQTQLFGDITDWYREELALDDAGYPEASLFQGQWRPLQRFEEVVEVANVPAMGSVGRTETHPRWTTFDGRWITAIEGHPASADTVPEEGQALVNVLGDWVIPADLDGDGVITAVSFDYTGLDRNTLIRASEGFGRSRSVHDFYQQTKRLVAYSQNLVVADRSGSILYTGYQAVPCRTYLPRNADGSFVEGADPQLLLDGTTYGGFTIPVVDGYVDESQADDPYRCVVPHAEYPASINPPEGWVMTANNDPGNISTDGDLFNDPWYIGGPWLEGYRAYRIAELLDRAVDEGWADEAGMALIQGDHHSNLGAQLLPELLDSVRRAREASEDPEVEEGSAEARMAALYLANAERIQEAASRLETWQELGLLARSGVQTFYDTPDDEDRQAAVATSIFNAWMGRYVRTLFDDEGWSGVFRPTGDTGRTRTLTLMLEGRGRGNPRGLASWNPDTLESAFFDILHTPEIESSHEVAVLALVEALDFLASPPDGQHGGFGTEDMDAWLWGLRHTVRFESLLGELISSDDALGFLLDAFSITTSVLPLDDSIAPGDPRRTLKWFPRNGDHLNVDASNSGLNGTRFSYGSGPVFRMVIALGTSGNSGLNVLPGGQSGLTDSPHYADQAALWLGNETLPMHLTLDEVLEAAQGREQFVPR